MKTRAGFSLIEVLSVILLVGIGSSVALIQMRNSMAVIDADRAANLVMGQLRYARQIAVDQRRNVLVQFTGASTIVVTRQDGGGATTVLSTVTLPSGFIYGLPTGPGDTPENFGNAAAVYFNGETSGTFLADGIFVNAGNIVVNGTVFTIGSGNVTSRAVTLTGASGRLKSYHLKGTLWIER
jgi:prepilin-type N-terminal cleavage/methylation domain-containing protein